MKSSQYAIYCRQIEKLKAPWNLGINKERECKIERQQKFNAKTTEGKRNSIGSKEATKHRHLAMFLVQIPPET